MENGKFPIDNPRRLKDWIKNTAKNNNLVANTVLQNYMMERFLERVSVSKYRDNIIIPREVDYSFKLMFEDRTIQVKAYNLNTVLAEKIESILARNVANTRARDYYDVYILLTTRAGDIDKTELLYAIGCKARERGATIYIEQHEKYLVDIRESRDLLALWEAYRGKYPYAANIEFAVIVDCLSQVFE
jgi:predicted nucleotidyltransferase component of viral defense system